MAAEDATAVLALNQRYLLDYPREAALRLESMPVAEAVEVLRQQPPEVALRSWGHLAAESAESILRELPASHVRTLLSELEPATVAALLRRLQPEERARYLDRLNPQVAHELRRLIEYTPETAGSLMSPRVVALRSDLRVRQALGRLRRLRDREIPPEIVLVDAEQRPQARLRVHRLALADPQQTLSEIGQPLRWVVRDLDTREEVVEQLERNRLTELPVTDFDGRLVGVIHSAQLVSAVHEELSTNIQTMVGASREERALSRSSFAIRKRLPWLHINLATAFLAASVVGIFESTIAQFTALAVLLPVVAGQSGNAGAQALAVTMRGLALREVTTRHWMRVAAKEVLVGALNGVAIAITTGLGVVVWSGSWGLALVIGVSMVISMVAAGLSGAAIPMVLTRLGQDPAQSSSIILTTVTDVVGFFSFLGIATALSTLL